MDPIKDRLYDVNAMPGKYAPFVAGNSSITETQGLGLRQQVDRYDKILAERKAAAEYGSKRLSGNSATIPTGSQLFVYFRKNFSSASYGPRQ